MLWLTPYGFFAPEVMIRLAVESIVQRFSRPPRLAYQFQLAPPDGSPAKLESFLDDHLAHYAQGRLNKRHLSFYPCVDEHPSHLIVYARSEREMVGLLNRANADIGRESRWRHGVDSPLRFRYLPEHERTFSLDGVIDEQERYARMVLK